VKAAARLDPSVLESAAALGMGANRVAAQLPAVRAAKRRPERKTLLETGENFSAPARV